MIYLGELTSVTDSKQKVGLIHYNIDLLSEEIIKNGILVDQPQEAQPQEGKIPVMYYDPTSNTAYYEMEDIPIQPKTKEEQLQEQVDQLALTVLQLQAQSGGAS
ncbi:hypothetical protein [Vallitalea sp.]|jgi:hypothetical protein|uniref:hypothetical protein n=1 Tax=Vallitalea sp. TaxID=1882829 RepID=UPI0025F6A5CE|nr:hypothetical protein [Vallitalea sp.]MCT4688815.1 hypothetical protein [Vallitalea sp.]